jgi:hypothetical protein
MASSAGTDLLHSFSRFHGTLFNNLNSDTLAFAAFCRLNERAPVPTADVYQNVFHSHIGQLQRIRNNSVGRDVELLPRRQHLSSKVSEREQYFPRGTVHGAAQSWALTGCTLG